MPAINYRGYVIRYDPPPIPVRKFDWSWHHEDFDLDDPRYGHSASLDGAKADIDEQIEEQGE
jgi:hypothetical protein